MAFKKTDEGSKQEILPGIIHTVGALSKLKTVWNGRERYKLQKLDTFKDLGHLLQGSCYE